MDEFITIAEPAKGYFMSSGSKFHAYAFHVSSESAAGERLEQVIREHSRATHHCTALRLRPDASFERINDDGEPSGSAGRPILGQIIKHGFTDIVVIVARYFGGTKLGIPGLIEAYKTSAAEALAAAKPVVKVVWCKVSILLPYDQLPALINVLKHRGFPVFDQSFDTQATILFGLRNSIRNELLLQVLQQFSKLDYGTVEAYMQHLNITVTMTDEVVAV